MHMSHISHRICSGMASVLLMLVFYTICHKMACMFQYEVYHTRHMAMVLSS